MVGNNSHVNKFFKVREYNNFIIGIIFDKKTNKFNKIFIEFKKFIINKFFMVN
jgi:hypothetical protein